MTVAADTSPDHLGIERVVDYEYFQLGWPADALDSDNWDSYRVGLERYAYIGHLDEDCHRLC